MLFADVAELADSLDLGSSVTDVGVQVDVYKRQVQYRPMYMHELQSRDNNLCT